MLKLMRDLDDKRDAMLKDLNEQKQAYMSDLSDSLDKQRAVRAEKATIVERLEYIKFELHRRVKAEQEMETTSTISHAAPEKKIEDRRTTTDLRGSPTKSKEETCQTRSRRRSCTRET